MLNSWLALDHVLQCSVAPIVRIRALTRVFRAVASADWGAPLKVIGLNVYADVLLWLSLSRVNVECPKRLRTA